MNDYKQMNFYALLCLLGIVLVLAVLVSGCSFVTAEDRKMTETLLHDSTGCAYVQGSGGAGASAVPAGGAAVPLGGGFGQGSLSVARSNTPGASVTCGPTGATVTNPAEASIE